ncbi:MAG: hypothetical protein ACE5LA_01945 [Dehalococcoidales bacterium]
MENLLARIGRLGFLILVGVFLIIYIALGILYFQQGTKQKDLEEQINKLRIVVAKPLPSPEKLRAEYDEVNRSLSPMSVPEAIAILVGIAERSGIDVAPGSGKFSVPPPGDPKMQKVGEGNYQILPFRSVKVQGDPDSVTAFLSDLDSGKTMKTLILKKVDVSWTQIRYVGEEAARREEFREVLAAVTAMMVDNALDEIPNPISYASGNATNYMGDDPNTVGTLEGFPDTTTTATQKGYTGAGTPKDGYLLYEHDKIVTDNATQFETVSYIDELTTQYYYTCETDGTVRQFDGPDIATATEYLGSEESRTETIVILDVDLYTKPSGGG